ncbi:MAG: hypothetical protein HUN04_17075 [Desulfobacter sp.]|nr:MAG: hypothetical protein HUN04_17075 [Desulfobacter sp.]
MMNRLKKLYFILLLPALVLFAAYYLALETKLVRPGQITLPETFNGLLFTLAAVTGIAGPIFIRTLFANKFKDQHQVPEAAFYSFQAKLLTVSGITPYIAFAAAACELPRFHAGAIVLMALYSLYYYFPSARRINFDRKLFRVKENAA